MHKLRTLKVFLPKRSFAVSLLPCRTVNYVSPVPPRGGTAPTATCIVPKLATRCIRAVNLEDFRKYLKIEEFTAAQTFTVLWLFFYEVDTKVVAAEGRMNGDKEVLSGHKNTGSPGIIKSSRGTPKNSGETPSCSISHPAPSTLFGSSVANRAPPRAAPRRSFPMAEL